jgi:hypothetical protein
VADGRIPLSHAGRDGQPAGRPVEYLRALLVAQAALPARNEPLAAWNAGRTVAQPASPIPKTAGPSPPTLAHIACVAILQEPAPTPETVLPHLRTALSSRVVVEQS